MGNKENFFPNFPVILLLRERDRKSKEEVMNLWERFFIFPLYLVSPFVLVQLVQGRCQMECLFSVTQSVLVD